LIFSKPKKKVEEKIQSEFEKILQDLRRKLRKFNDTEKVNKQIRETLNGEMRIVHEGDTKDSV